MLRTMCKNLKIGKKSDKTSKEMYKRTTKELQQKESKHFETYLMSMIFILLL